MGYNVIGVYPWIFRNEPHRSPEVPAQFPILCMYLMGANYLPPIAQPPEENCYDYLYAL